MAMLGNGNTLHALNTNPVPASIVVQFFEGATAIGVNALFTLSKEIVW